MKLLVILLLALISTHSLRSEEFFATANEALILGEIALKQNKIASENLILIRMEIRGPKKGGKSEGPYKAIYEQMGDRPSWLLFYKSKDSFTTDSLYIHEYTVILLSKTEAAVVVHGGKPAE